MQTSSSHREDFEHTLVYGGDFTLGRMLNEALFDPVASKQIFSNIAPLFRAADIALVNGEGVITQGGMYFDKGEPRPFMYRAHPEAISVLKDAGIDVVAVGNNHFGDYGRGAMREMLDRLRLAGIDYTGGGVNEADAFTPAYLRAGDLVVAVVGGDFTLSGRFAAQGHKSGTVHYNAFLTDRFEDDIVKRLKQIHDTARQFAQVVILTPHWGENWKSAPSPEIRSLAKRLMDVGYDAILGHSAHMIQGVEVIHGRPVIYDAGNLVSDLPLGGHRQEGMVWRLTFNHKGITKAEAYPVLLKKNQTTWMSPLQRKQVLESLQQSSARLGATLTLSEDSAQLTLSPLQRTFPVLKKAPLRPIPNRVRPAENDMFLSALPTTATPLSVTYPEGIALLGSELITEKLSVPKGGQIIQTFWKTTSPITGNYYIHLEARHSTDDTSPSRRVFERHLPGDWFLPTAKWPQNEIIHDWNLFRLKFVPRGTVRFFAALARNNQLIAPLQSNVEIVDKYLIPIGEAAYTKDARWLFDYLNQRRTQAQR